MPKFLLDIYKQLSEKDDESNDEDIHLERKRRSIDDNYDSFDEIIDTNEKIIEESDIIMTFLNNRKLLLIDPHFKKKTMIWLRKMWFLGIFCDPIGNNLPTVQRDSNSTRLSFDLSEVSTNGTSLLMSELHLYKRRLPENDLQSSFCMITIYAVTVVDG